MDERHSPAHAPRRNLTVLPAAALASAVGLALVVAWSAYDARIGREELRSLMEAGGSALAETLGHAVENTLASGREIEELASARLLDVARLVERLEASGRLDARRVADLAARLDLLRVAVFDARLEEILASAQTPETGPGADPFAPSLAPLAAGDADEILFQPRETSASGEPVFAAGVRRGRGGAVLVVMDARAMLAFREKVGAARLMDAVAGSGGILYAVLEDDDGNVVTGAPEALPVQEFTVLEIEHPVEIAYGRMGRLRIGLSTDALTAAEEAGRRRVLVVGLIAGALAAAVMGIAAARQRALGLRRRLESEERRGGTLAAFGRLAASVAHEVRNPLNAISVGVQRLEREFSPSGREDEYVRVTGLLREEVNRLDGIVSRFLDLARPPALEPRPGDLAALVRETMPLLRDAAPPGVRIVEEASSAAHCVFDPGAIRQILHNLVRNAVEAVGQQGEVQVAVRSGRRGAVIEVADDGPGIRPEDRERVFEFGFTTKPQGNGLGLPIVHRLVTEMGGSVEIDTALRRGALVRLFLPPSQTPAA